MTLHPWQPRRLAAIVLLSAATIVGVALWRPPNPEERTSIPRNDAPLKANKDTADKSGTAHPVARPLKGTGPATLAPGAVPAVPSPSDSPGITKGRTPPVPLVRAAPGVRPAGPASGPAGNRPSPPPALAAAEEEEPLPPFVAPTPEQIRDQPSATTAAQILSQRLNLSDPAVEKEVTRLLTLSYETRKRMAWERAKQLGLEIRGQTAGGGSFELEDFDETGRPIYNATENVNAAISTATHQVREQAAFEGVDGAGMTVGVWDGAGVRTTHQEFNNGGIARVVVQDGSASVNGSGEHATHVSAMIAGAGVNPLLKGMAPAAQVKFWSKDNGVAEMTGAGSTLPLDGKLLVGSGSYGIPMGWERDRQGNWLWHGALINDGNPANDIERWFGLYNNDATALDGLAYNRPYFLIVRSAGNQRDNGPPQMGAAYTHVGSGQAWAYAAGDPPGDGQYAAGYDTLGAEKTAKNILCVGAATDAVTGGNRDVTVAAVTDFSSWGPTDDGRIKPDVMANGHEVLSASNTADDASTTMSGTSMATPNASGSAILLQQLYMNLAPDAKPMRAATLKGLIIHTADNLGPIGPDYQTGWGLMNTKAAADTVKAHFGGQNGGALIEDRLTSTGGPKTYRFAWDGSKPLRATVCWTDPPLATADINHNDRNADLVNDLDLTVTRDGGAPILPYVMPFALGTGTMADPAIRGANHRDNVEQVFVPIVEVVPGLYTITINRTGALKDNVPQDFSLILTGCLPPAEIAVETSQGKDLKDGVDTVSFGSVPPGEIKEQSFTIRNKGVGALSDLSVSCDGAHASQFTISQPAGSVDPNQTTTFTVTFTPAEGTPLVRTAVLRIDSNDPDESPFDITLTGRAEAPNDVTKAWSDKLDQWSYGRLVAIDPSGNVYAAGLLQFGAQFEETRIYLFKYAAGNGQLLWQKEFTCSFSPPTVFFTAPPVSLQTDSAGNVCLAMQDASVYGRLDTRLAKVAANGTLMWDITVQNEMSVGVVDMQMDAVGNVIIAGSTSSAESNRGLVAKFGSANGTLLWQREDSSWYPSEFALDGGGNVLVVATELTPEGTGNRFHVEKYAAAGGSTLWERDITPPVDSFAATGDAISVNSAGDVAFRGLIMSNETYSTYLATLDGDDGHTVWSVHDTQSVQGYINQNFHGRTLHYGADGKVTFIYGSQNASVTGIRQYHGGTSPVWTTVIGDTNSPDPNQKFLFDVMAFDQLGNPVVSGHDDQDAKTWITAKYAVTDGALLWRASETDANPNMRYRELTTFYRWGAVATGAGGRVAVTGTLYDISNYAQPRIMHTILYASNDAPQIATDANSLFVEVKEAQAATATGTFSDGNGNATVTLTATRDGQPFGVLTRNDTAGTWSWTKNPTDGPDDSGFVIIAANDGASDPVTTSISLTVQNVAPDFDAGANASLTPEQATTFSRAITFTDPGADVWTATVDYGDGTAVSPVTVNQGSKSFTLSHNYAQVGVYPVTVTVSDGDVAGSFSDTFNVTVERLITDWRMTHFGTSSNTGNAANDADGDKDGVTNLAEFALGTDPHQSSAQQLPQGSRTASDPNAPQSLDGNEDVELSPTHYSLVVAEPPGTTGITYGAEYSTDLQSWLPVADTGEDGIHVFSVPIQTNTFMFMRLVITEQ